MVWRMIPSLVESVALAGALMECSRGMRRPRPVIPFIIMLVVDVVLDGVVVVLEGVVVGVVE